MATTLNLGAVINAVVLPESGRRDYISPPDMSVLHVINGEHFAGAERVQSHLGRCLPEFGVAIDFACLNPKKFPEVFDVAGSVLYDVTMKSRFDLSAVSRLKRIVQRGRYDLLHAHTPRSAMITALAARSLSIPWVYHVHSPTANDSTRRLQNYINAFIEKNSLRRAAHQIAVSSSLREHTIAAGWHAESVSVVHNGVPSATNRRVAPPVIGAPLQLGMIALHRPRKGLEVLIDAMSLLKRIGCPVKLRCIGPFESDAYEESIVRRAIDRNVSQNIHFTGFTSDVSSEMLQLDAMVLPSLFGEGMPMVVLEAMATGIPVIATSVEGTPEAIRHNTEGLLAEPGCPKSLATQIKRMAMGEVDWQSLSQSAVARHEGHFSDRAMSRKVADVYRAVLGVE